MLAFLNLFNLNSDFALNKYDTVVLEFILLLSIIHSKISNAKEYLLFSNNLTAALNLLSIKF